MLLLYVVTALVFLVFWFCLLRAGCGYFGDLVVGLDWFRLWLRCWFWLVFYDCLVLVHAVFLWLRLICDVWLFTVSC